MPELQHTLPAGLRPVLDSAREALLVLRASGEIVLANSAAARQGAGEGAPLWDLPWWGDSPGMRVRIQGAVAAAAAGERATLVLEGCAPAASRAIDLSIAPIEDGPAAPFLLAEAQDITEHHRLAKELRAAVAHHQTVLASTLDPVVTIDFFGTILSVSRSIERVFGYTPDEVIGRNVRMLMPEPHHSAHDSYLANYRLTGQTNILGRTREFDAVRKDGTRIPIELSVSRVDVPGQESPIFTGIIHDISERRAAERLVRDNAAALERSNKDLEQFAYVASHDLQEPLRMVGSFAGLLSRRYKGKLDAEADEFIAYIIDGAERMKMLIEDLLTFSRVSTKGKLPERTSLQTIVDRVLTDLRGAMEEAGAQVLVEPLPEVVADVTQLSQVMLNLIGNAIKFRGAQPPAVRLWAEAAGPDWIISVQDNGIGIDPKYADRIFHIFERLHGAAEYPGTGIGLAICRKIVERHGGRIWVESAPGQGSTFRFTLPRAENPS